MKKNILLIMLLSIIFCSCKKDQISNNNVKITTDPSTLPLGYISAIIDDIPTAFTVVNYSLHPNWNSIGATYDTTIGLPYLYNELWMDGNEYYPHDSSESIRLDFSNPNLFTTGLYPCLFTPGIASKISSFGIVYYAKHVGAISPEFNSMSCVNPAPMGGVITNISIPDSSFQGTFSGTVANIDASGNISYHSIVEGAFNVKILETKPNNDQ